MNPNAMPRKTNTRRVVPIRADEITSLSNRLDAVEEQLRDMRELISRQHTDTRNALQALLDLIDTVAGIDE